MKMDHHHSRSWNPSPTSSSLSPSSSFHKRPLTMTTTSTYVPSLWSKQNRPELSMPETFLSRHKVGDPMCTAFDINDRGNRVYIKFEPYAQRTFFPVNETRFYKPKVHKMDFLGTGKFYGCDAKVI